jgi:catechol-2,3-dioxygenase
MTDPQICGLRSIEFGVTDVEKAARFYENCWYLEPVATQDGTRYFRATGPEHHIVVLHERPTAGVECVNYAAQDKATVDAMHTRLEGLGANVTEAPAPLSTPGGGYGFSFRDPDGHKHRISSDVTPHGDSTMADDRPFKLSHVVFNSERVDDQTDYFRDVMGFKLSDRTERMHFMRCSADHHSIALARMGGPSLNHTAFEVPDFDALMRGAGRMKRKGFTVDWGVGRHGPGNNIFTYFREPDGLVVEYTAEVERVDDSYKVGEPADWSKLMNGPDRWGFSGPPSAAIRQAMGGHPQPPGVDFD